MFIPYNVISDLNLNKNTYLISKCFLMFNNTKR